MPTTTTTARHQQDYQPPPPRVEEEELLLEEGPLLDRMDEWILHILMTVYQPILWLGRLLARIVGVLLLAIIRLSVKGHPLHDDFELFHGSSGRIGNSGDLSEDAAVDDFIRHFPLGDDDPQFNSDSVSDLPLDPLELQLPALPPVAQRQARSATTSAAVIEEEPSSSRSNTSHNHNHNTLSYRPFAARPPAPPFHHHHRYNYNAQVQAQAQLQQQYTLRQYEHRLKAPPPEEETYDQLLEREYLEDRAARKARKKEQKRRKRQKRREKKERKRAKKRAREMGSRSSRGRGIPEIVYRLSGDKEAMPSASLKQQQEDDGNWLRMRDSDDEEDNRPVPKKKKGQPKEDNNSSTDEDVDEDEEDEYQHARKKRIVSSSRSVGSQQSQKSAVSQLTANSRRSAASGTTVGSRRSTASKRSTASRKSTASKRSTTSRSTATGTRSATKSAKKPAYSNNKEALEQAKSKIQRSKGKAVFDLLADGKTYTRAAIGKAIGHDHTNRSFNNILGPLRTLHYIEYVFVTTGTNKNNNNKNDDQRACRMLDDMFPFGRPETDSAATNNFATNKYPYAASSTKKRAANHKRNAKKNNKKRKIGFGEDDDSDSDSSDDDNDDNATMMSTTSTKSAASRRSAKSAASSSSQRSTKSAASRGSSVASSSRRGRQKKEDDSESSDDSDSSDSSNSSDDNNDDGVPTYRKLPTCVEEIPPNYVERFLSVGFAPWNRKVLPCMIVSPFDFIDGSRFQRVWMSSARKFLRDHGSLDHDSMPLFVYWFTDKTYAMIPAEKFVPYREADDKWKEIPHGMLRKLELGKTLTDTETMYLEGLQEASEFAKDSSDMTSRTHPQLEKLRASQRTRSGKARMKEGRGSHV